MVIGILAHVDAGKTTLSEGMLYLCGSIRRLGRVDKRDTFLDTDIQERERGITIFSRQALLSIGNTRITLLDTPGHVDFSAEMERTLQVLDYGILVIGGRDGVREHTLTLWRLLKHYGIPVFLFINKMDRPEADKEEILGALRSLLSENCIDFSRQEGAEFFESIAVCEEDALNEFLETGEIRGEHIAGLIRERQLFPCFFGSALKTDGVEELLQGLDRYTIEKKYPEEFGARVFKITRDTQGNRLTHMKITGGSLRAKDVIAGVCGQDARRESAQEDVSCWEEKVNQIRFYSGDKYRAETEAGAGEICAVTGLTKTWAGEGLGYEREAVYPQLEPVLGYEILLPKECDPAVVFPRFQELEEEEPQLHPVWDEKTRKIRVQIMGQVQMEVYQKLIQERLGIHAEFGTGSIVYKETIADTVEGVGHYEPLRHYAEVHLLMEPGEPGSGLQISSEVSEDVLDRNWQRLILTHLREREHPGVLMGAPITDMKITLKAGKSHLKHTEGGDFRQAVYRALRQGLMQAESILLEPYNEFTLEVPEYAVGRAMTDLENRHGTFSMENTARGMVRLKGMAPVALLGDYQKEVIAYTRGAGQLVCTMKGYFPCHNTEEVLTQKGYDPLTDAENPVGSVFCIHGAGTYVEWNRVPEFMHLESCLPKGGFPEREENKGSRQDFPAGIRRGERGRNRDREEDRFIGQEEIEDILKRTSHANRKEDRVRTGWKRSGRSHERAAVSKAGFQEAGTGETGTRVCPSVEKKEEYLLVDGYNVIFAWEELKELAQHSLDGARGKLLDILCNYQAVKKCSLIAVFDAYRLEGHPTQTLDYHNIHVVFTAQAETADQYIERFSHENSRKYDITVATSDGLEQVIITGEGCKLISSREFKEEIRRASVRILEDFGNANPIGKNTFTHALAPEALEEINAFYQRSQKK